MEKYWHNHQHIWELQILLQIQATLPTSQGRQDRTKTTAQPACSELVHKSLLYDEQPTTVYEVW